MVHVQQQLKHFLILLLGLGKHVLALLRQPRLEVHLRLHVVDAEFLKDSALDVLGRDRLAEHQKKLRQIVDFIKFDFIIIHYLFFFFSAFL
jgi:hypothetical protein